MCVPQNVCTAGTSMSMTVRSHTPYTIHSMHVIEQIAAAVMSMAYTCTYVCIIIIP